MADNGELPEGREPDSVANQMFALICGLKVMERMRFEPQQRRDCLQMVEALLN